MGRGQRQRGSEVMQGDTTTRSATRLAVAAIAAVGLNDTCSRQCPHVQPQAAARAAPRAIIGTIPVRRERAIDSQRPGHNEANGAAPSAARAQTVVLPRAARTAQVVRFRKRAIHIAADVVGRRAAYTAIATPAARR